MISPSAEDKNIERSNTSEPLAIDVRGLSFRYPKATTDTLNVSHWQVSVGERVFLQGASGSGKSTLLQLLCGLKVGKGALNIAGTAIGELSSTKRDHFRARHIGMVFQQFNLIPYLSMLDNLKLAAGLAGRGTGVEERASVLLEQVGLSPRLWKQPVEALSIGQQQRVAIARALLNSPAILLFDEPTSALDDDNQVLFMNVLQEHVKRHPEVAVVFVSHDARLASYFDKSLKLSDITSADQARENANAP